MDERLTSEQLNKKVTVERKPAIVLFTGIWCGDCMEFAPTWRKWSAGKSASIYRVEVERGGPEWNDWELDEIPTVAVYSDGAEKGRAEGVILEEDLDALLRLVTVSEPANGGIRS